MANVNDDLVVGFINHFWSADHQIKWLRAEVEAQVWLSSNTLLVGRVDAIGETESETFFGEWKTANPRGARNWKEVWRLNPQSLTYGVLVDSIYPGTRRFTVRKAFKSAPPTYDHAWFRYSDAELEQWKFQLKNVADEIREYRRWTEGRPWPTNFGHCFQYGPAYACPFFEPACSLGEFGAAPANAIVRISHLECERRLNDNVNRTVAESEGTVTEVYPDDLVVLDATRVATWFACRQRYRREYEDNVTVPPGEALQTGIEFHELVGKYVQGLIDSQKKYVEETNGRTGEQASDSPGDQNGR